MTTKISTSVRIKLCLYRLFTQTVDKMLQFYVFELSVETTCSFSQVLQSWKSQRNFILNWLKTQMEIIILANVFLMQRIRKRKTQVIKRALCPISKHLSVLLLHRKIIFFLKKATVPFAITEACVSAHTCMYIWPHIYKNESQHVEQSCNQYSRKGEWETVTRTHVFTYNIVIPFG